MCLLIVLQARRPRPQGQQVWGLPRPLSWACRWLFLTESSQDLSSVPTDPDVSCVSELVSQGHQLGQVGAYPNDLILTQWLFKVLSLIQSHSEVPEVRVFT